MFPLEKKQYINHTSFMRGDTVDTNWLIGQTGSRPDFKQDDPGLRPTVNHEQAFRKKLSCIGDRCETDILQIDPDPPPN